MSPMDPQTPATRGATSEDMRRCERPARENARRSVVARHNMAAGPTPAAVDRVVGARLLHSLELGEPVRPEDVE